MESVLNSLKGHVNSFNLVMASGIVSWVFFRLNRKRVGRILAIVPVLLFLLFSTRYLPAFLIRRIERAYAPFSTDRYPAPGSTVYIHVLGGGYTMDKRLPPQARLSTVGLGRLSEALRIYRLYDSSVLVMSGNVISGHESVASVTREAAIALGASEERVQMLETPATTFQEAREFAKRYGTDAPIILVTDAVHMPRAMEFFRFYGCDPFPAPTNYLIKEAEDEFTFDWIPAAENFLLMDRVIRETLGGLKGKWEGTLSR